jgi:hypothetical protein
MSEVFSQYVTLVDEIEQIPIMARESRTLSTEQRTAVMAQVVALVRDRVLPQSDRDCASREALLDDEDASDRAAAAGVGDHDAILAPLDELARANPSDAARVQRLMYQVHSAIAGRFSQAELILASMGDDEYELASRAPRITGGRFVRREYARPSAWFG